MVQRNKVQVLFLDYLQKMAAPKQYAGNREAEVNYNVQSLKNIAKELKLPFICLSQLSRAVESRADKKPILSDLRESGAIEQEADMVLFLWRPEYYGITQDAEGNDMSDGYVELDVAKFRHGPTMTIPIKFIGELTKFTDYRHPDDFKGIQQAPVSDFNAWGNAIHDAPVISQHRPNLDVEIPF
jgi:replicative DNA helicase